MLPTPFLVPPEARLPYSFERESAMSSSPPKIHPTACVDRPCEIGDGTRIWNFTHVRENAKIGETCNIGQNVYVGAGYYE